MSDFSKTEKDKAAALFGAAPASAEKAASSPSKGKKKKPNPRTRRRAKAQPRKSGEKTMAKAKRAKKGASKGKTVTTKSGRKYSATKYAAMVARGKALGARAKAAAAAKKSPGRKAGKKKAATRARSVARSVAPQIIERIVEVPVARKRKSPSRRRPSPRRAPRGYMREPGETVLASPSGEAVAPGRLGHLQARIEAHVPVLFDQVAIGAMLDGFIGAMRSPASPDLSAMYPEFGVDAAHHNHPLWQKYAQEREIGRQLWKHVGLAMLKNNVTAAEFAGYVNQVWQGIAAAAARRPQVGAPAGVPMIPPQQGGGYQ